MAFNPAGQVPPALVPASRKDGERSRGMSSPECISKLIGVILEILKVESNPGKST
jgi:hypothetical protein